MVISNFMAEGHPLDDGPSVGVQDVDAALGARGQGASGSPPVMFGSFTAPPPS